MAAKARQNKPLKSAPSIPKPGESVQKKTEEKKPNPIVGTSSEESSEEMSTSTVQKLDLNAEELKKVVNQFVEQNKVGPLVENSLKNSIHLEEQMITVELSNPVEVDGIEKIKADFLNFIRAKFQNQEIQLQHHVNIEKAAERPYTPKEKFDAMMKENPLLGKLRDAFGLDPDY